MLTLVELFPDARDREVVELMAEGERDSMRYAKALGCGRLALAEQRLQVKRAKDRIRLRLKRYGIRLHY